MLNKHLLLNAKSCKKDSGPQEAHSLVRKLVCEPVHMSFED